MRLALTGVPGVGKTTIAQKMGQLGWRVVHLSEYARDAGLLVEKDDARGAYVLDMDDLADSLNTHLRGYDGDVVIESHFAHEMDVHRIVLLRADPLVLIERLRARGWREEKVRENVEAEALDVVAHDVLETGILARELDVTRLGVDESAQEVLAIAESRPEALKGRPVGSAAWSLESLPWS